MKFIRKGTFADNTVYINFALIVIDFVKAFCFTQIDTIIVWFDNRRNKIKIKTSR